MASRGLAITPPASRSVQLAQATTLPWGQIGVSGDTARGLGLANPRGVAPAIPEEPVPRLAKLVRWISIGLTIAEVLKTIAGPAPVYKSEISLDDAGDLAIRIFGKSYKGPEAGTALFTRGIGGASLGVTATVTEDGLRFDAGALERAYGKALPTALASAAAGTIPTVVERRDNAVSSNLSTVTSQARALVASQARFRRWQAHHLIPFSEVQRLPVASQLAIAKSGWKMDSLENLVVLPADVADYEDAPNFTRLPYHQGPHPKYNLEVENRLNHLRTEAPKMSAHDIRDELQQIEETMFQQLLDKRRGFHPRVSLNAHPQTRSFG